MFSIDSAAAYFNKMASDARKYHGRRFLVDQVLESGFVLTSKKSGSKIHVDTTTVDRHGDVKLFKGSDEIEYIDFKTFYTITEFGVLCMKDIDMYARSIFKIKDKKVVCGLKIGSTIDILKEFEEK